VVVTGSQAQPLPQQRQQLIAGAVAMGVVDQFEAVQVEQEDAVRMAPACPLVQVAHQPATVGQSGQGVGVSLAAGSGDLTPAGKPAEGVGDAGGSGDCG
jgi:hypothetical protein